MPKSIEHSLNWCRLCRTCLTCKRFPRNIFRSGDCKCEERHLTHRAKDVKNNWTTDFRFRHLQRGEVIGLTHLAQEMEGLSRPIEPNLVRANLCGTCQQRLRRAVEAAKEPVNNNDSIRYTNADFRKHRSIRETIRQRKLASNTPLLARSSSMMVQINDCDDSNADRLQTQPEHQLAPDSSPSAGGSVQPPATEPASGDYLSSGLANKPRTATSDSASRFACLSRRPASSAKKNRVYTVSVIDAGSNLLFTEKAVGAMTLRELVYAYFPGAPYGLIYREMHTEMLVSGELPISNIEAANDKIFVKVHVPAATKPAHWHLERQNDACPYPSPRERGLPSAQALANRRSVFQLLYQPSADNPRNGYDRNPRSADTGSSHGHNASSIAPPNFPNTSSTRNSEPRLSYASSNRSSVDQSLPNLSYSQLWNPRSGQQRESSRASISVQSLTNPRISNSRSSSNDRAEYRNVHTVGSTYNSNK